MAKEKKTVEPVEREAKLMSNDPDYVFWIQSVKERLRRAQLKAVVAVNREMLQFYWELGADIVQKQATARWGEGFIKQISVDLTVDYPGSSGFSVRNIKYLRQWYRFYTPQIPIGQQPVAQLGSTTLGILFEVPWGHHVVIVTKCKRVEEALYYVQQTIAHGWSRSVLMHQIESGLYTRDGKAVTNFGSTLPAAQSDLAQQTLKDPYKFDFLAMSQDFTERDLENALTDHITRFLLELGAGFAYMGRQVPLTVGTRDFAIDLLFYHTRLHCHVVVELKTGEFEPEYAGKLNFYIKAVDEQIRKKEDGPTIGILLCKTKDRLVAEYSLSGIGKPMGVSEYQLTHALPENLKSNLPSVEEIESELGADV